MMRPTRKAFALPMVILLLLVSGMTISVALRRHTAQSFVVERQLRSYQEHHGARGLQETIAAWLQAIKGREIVDVIGERGHALDLILADGSTVSIFLQDGQGQALSNLNALTGQSLEEAGDLLAHLVSMTSPKQYETLIRSVGPMAISPTTADEMVLLAAMRAATDSSTTADRLVDGILDLRRGDRRVTRTDFTTVMTQAGVTSQERAAVQRMLAFDSELWWVIVEITAGRGQRSGRLVSRYGGLALLRSSSRSSTSFANRPPTPFLTWQDMGVGPDAQLPPGVQ